MWPTTGGMSSYKAKQVTTFHNVHNGFSIWLEQCVQAERSNARASFLIYVSVGMGKVEASYNGCYA